MRPNFACGVSSPFLTLPPMQSVGGQEVGGPWEVPGVPCLTEKKKFFLVSMPQKL